MKNRVLNVTSSFLKLGKHFKELRDKELSDRERKIRGKIGDLFYKPIIVSIDDMNKCEEKNDEEETFAKKLLLRLIN